MNDKMVRVHMVPPDAVRFELSFFNKDDINYYHPYTGTIDDLQDIPSVEYVKELEKRNREMFEEIDRLRFKVAEYVSKEITAQMLVKRNESKVSQT